MVQDKKLLWGESWRLWAMPVCICVSLMRGTLKLRSGQSTGLYQKPVFIFADMNFSYTGIPGNSPNNIWNICVFLQGPNSRAPTLAKIFAWDWSSCWGVVAVVGRYSWETLRQQHRGNNVPLQQQASRWEYIYVTTMTYYVWPILTFVVRNRRCGMRVW